MKRAVEFAHLGANGRLASLSELEIELHFTLSPEERDAVLERRGAANRLGLALQVGLLRATGGHAERTIRIQPEVLHFLGGQLGIAAPDIASPRSLYRRTGTLLAHRRDAAAIAGFRALTDGVRSGLVAHLNREAVGATGTKDLVGAARIWLRTHRTIAPRTRDLARLAHAAWQRRLGRLDLSIRASAESGGWLEDLAARTASGRPALEWLGAGPRRRSAGAFEGEMAKIAMLRRMGADRLDLDSTPVAAIAIHARRIVRRKPSEIARLASPGRMVALACYLRWELGRRLDLAVELLIFLITDLQRTAQIRAHERLAREAPGRSRQMSELIGDLAALVKDTDLDADGLRAALSTLIAPHREKPAVTSMAQATREAMAESPPMLRRLTACIGELGLEVAEDHPLHAALKMLDRLKSKPDRALPPGTANPFGRAWAPLIDGPDRNLALGAWRAATLLLLKRSLRNGQASIPASHGWRSPDNHLIPRQLWEQDRGRFLSDLGVDKAAGAFLRVLEPALETALKDLGQAVETGAIAIADGRLRIPRPARDAEDPGILSTRDALLARIGPVELPDVIMDVDRATGLSRILLGRDAASDREQLQLYGAILALGSDLDAAQAARMIAGASAEGIGVMIRRLEHGDRIRAANAALVDKTGALEVARFWGEGVHASADMMSLDAARGLWSARVDPRRRTRAVGTYTHVLDRWALVYDQPIVLNERQAGAAIEGALRQENALIERVAVDTHGVTHASMALAKLLGFDICPRLAGLADRKLYVFRDTALPAVLEPIASRTLSRRRIATGWDGLAWLAASTRRGWCSAVWAMRRHGSASTGDPVHRAADELGRLLRTIFLCDYLANPAFRTEIEALLARGEATHPLQRALHDGAIAPRRGRQPEQLRAVSGALTLLTNIVIAWNAIRFDEILRSPDFPHPHEHMAHIAPIHHRHINLRGTFHFDLTRLTRPGSDPDERRANGP